MIAELESGVDHTADRTDDWLAGIFRLGSQITDPLGVASPGYNLSEQLETHVEDHSVTGGFAEVFWAGGVFE